MNNNKVVLITGATGGIGQYLVESFAKKKYKVAVHFKQNQAEANKLKKKIRGKKGELLTIQSDVSSSKEVGEVVKKIILEWGRIDVLINNAAICQSEILPRLTEAVWDKVIATDLTGAFFCLRAVAKVMLKQKQGSIINIGSILGIRGGIGDTAYSAAKAGLVSLTKTAAIELGRFGICVNAVLPGCHRTAMLGKKFSLTLERARQESVLSLTTADEELAEFVVFLSQTKTVSGQVFNWDSRII